MRSTTDTARLPRQSANRRSRRRASVPVSQGTTVADRISAMARISPAAGSIHHMTATVAVPPTSAMAKGGTTRTMRSWSESTSWTIRASRSPLRNSASPDGASCLEVLIDLHPEVGDEAERRVMTGEPLAVAEEPAGQPEELDPDDRHTERRLARVLGRPRDQPRGGAHQPDARGNRAGSQEGCHHHPPQCRAGDGHGPGHRCQSTAIGVSVHRPHACTPTGGSRWTTRSARQSSEGR